MTKALASALNPVLTPALTTQPRRPGDRLHGRRLAGHADHPGLEREPRAEAGRRGFDPRATQAFVDAAAIQDAAGRLRAGIPPGAVPTGTDRAATEDVRYLVQVAGYLP